MIGGHDYKDAYIHVLDTLRPERIFEWGPGLQTRLAVKRKWVKEIFAIEQEKKWLPEKGDRRLSCLWVGIWNPHYVHLHNREHFDLFFIDSRRREECLDLVRTSTQGNPDVVVCLHDAQRPEYHAPLYKFAHVRLLNEGFAVASHSDIVDRFQEVPLTKRPVDAEPDQWVRQLPGRNRS